MKNIKQTLSNLIMTNRNYEDRTFNELGIIERITNDFPDVMGIEIDQGKLLFKVFFPNETVEITDPRYTLTPEDQRRCIEQRDEQEQTIPQYCNENGHLTVCQLFENDFLCYGDDDDIPENLQDIDWTFLNRPFDLTPEQLTRLRDMD